MGIYIIVFSLIFFLKNDKRVNIFCFTVLTLFTILRFDVGWDYRWYYHLAGRYDFEKLNLFIKLNEILEYIKIYNDWESWQFYRIELINKILYLISWKIKLPPQFVIIFYGFFTLFFIKKGLDKEKIFTKNAWLIYFCFPLMWFSHISIMRQGLASSLIFFGYRYIKKEKFFKYCFIVLMASLIHKTSFIMIILYFIYKLKNFLNRKLYIILLITVPFFKTIVLYIIKKYSIPLINSYKYFIFDRVGDGGTKIYWIMLLLFLLLIFSSFLFRELYLENKYLISIVIFGLYIYISLISFGHVGPRIAAYFLIFLLYLVPYIENILNKINLPTNLIGISMLIIMLLTLYVDTHGIVRTQFVPYKFIFLSNGIISIK